MLEPSQIEDTTSRIFGPKTVASKGSEDGAFGGEPYEV
jgi:hypothetical protein